MSYNPEWWAKKLAEDPQYRRRHKIKHLYNISLEDFDEILVSQGGHCALCPRTSHLCVDHDHATGDVRGILCKGCNGAVRDIEWHEVAMSYIERHRKDG